MSFPAWSRHTLNPFSHHFHYSTIPGCIYSPLSLSHKLYVPTHLSFSLPPSHTRSACECNDQRSSLLKFHPKTIEILFFLGWLVPSLHKSVGNSPRTGTGRSKPSCRPVQSAMEGPGSQLVGCTRANTQRETGGCDVMARAGWSVTR